MTALKILNHLEIGTLTFGLADKNDNEVLFKQISNLLISCSTQLAESEGGHVPDWIVKERIQTFYTTMDSIKLIGPDLAKRFVLINQNKQLLATALIACSPGVLMPEHTHGVHNEIDLISQASLTKKFHSVFNVAVDLNYRYLGLASLLIRNIFEFRNLYFSGKGLYVRSEPPDHDVWFKLGFTHVKSLDEYFNHVVDLPLGIKDPNEFNLKYCCTCTLPSGDSNSVRDKKLKYHGFLKNF